MSDYLCEEFMADIFVRLPLKSLLRFRSLSKSSCSIISSPGFIHRHMCTFRSPQKLLFRHGSSYKNVEDFYTLHGEDELPLCLERGYNDIIPVKFPFGRDFCLVGSCDVILCLYDYLEERRISLWNPSIRRKLTLPDCPQRCFSLLRTGFGFDPITHDYKIVSIYNDISYVYAMKIGAWCAIASPTRSFYEVLSNACYVNGALHWVVEVEPLFSELNDLRYILTFDLSTHVFGRVALPKTGWKTRELTTIQGSLALISYSVDHYHDDDDDEDYYNDDVDFYDDDYVDYYYNDDVSWNIWVRRDASWSFLFKLKTNQVQGRICRILQLASTGDLLFNTLNEGFQVYDSKIGAQSKLVNFSADSCVEHIVMCVESLQLLDTGTAC